MIARITRHAHALVVVVAVRLALWLLPLPTVSAVCAAVPIRARRAIIPGPSPLAGIVIAVHRAARVVPHATCLTQALAAQRMLGRVGIRSDVRFGVALDAARLAAHAWLEVDGRTVIGHTPTAYAPLRRTDPSDVG